MTGSKEEIIERLANIETKLDALIARGVVAEAAPKRARATISEARLPCAYIKKSGESCGKNSRPDTEYCADHPEGMTRAAFNKKKQQEEGGAVIAGPVATKISTPRLTFEKDEENNLQKIRTPIIFKGTIVSIEQPYKAYFQSNTAGKAKRLTPALIKQLEAANITIAPEDEQEDLLGTLNLEWEAPAAKSKPRIQLDSDSDSDDEPPVKKMPIKSKTESKTEVKPKPESKTEVKPKTESKTESKTEVKPKTESKPESKTESKPESKTESKTESKPESKKETKPMKKDSDSDSDDSDAEIVKKPRRAMPKIVDSDSSSDDVSHKK